MTEAAKKCEATTVVDLDFPIQVDGQTVDKITIRRPKVKDLRKMEEGRKAAGDDPDLLDLSVQMCVVLTGLDPSAFDDMDAGDFEKVSDVIGNFMPGDKSPGTGEE